MNWLISLTLVSALLPIANHDERDDKAQAAFQKLQGGWNEKAQEMGLTQGEPSEEKLIAFYRDVIGKDLEAFAKEWKGTHAAIEATMGLASIRSNERFGGSFDEGYKVAAALLEDLAKDADHSDSFAQATVQTVMMCLDADQFEKAEKHLEAFLAMAEAKSKALAEGEELEAEIARAVEHLMGIKESLPIRKQLAVGKKFPAFTSMTVTGKETGPHNYTGKVVLVDFWATWCGPCVGELPNVLEAYAKFHEKGFEILGISLDNDKGKLEKFIEDRKMPWEQVFDGNGWQNEVAVKFGVNSIPATFLLDRHGVLRYKDLRGDELIKRVEELLAEEVKKSE